MWKIKTEIIPREKCKGLINPKAEINYTLLSRLLKCKMLQCMILSSLWNFWFEHFKLLKTQWSDICIMKFWESRLFHVISVKIILVFFFIVRLTS